ncbi:unnamed protein product [Cunninghamella blakesleeana]
MPFFICPATCELCGQWMPSHAGNCPRKGVHPSKWATNNESIVNILSSLSSFVDITNPNDDDNLLVQDELNNHTPSNSL